MQAKERREAIVEVVRHQGPATVSELVDRLGLSEATIRRDLVKLDDAGLLKRVHGGARPVDLRDDVYADLVDRAAEPKEAIARAAAARVQDGQSVLLDIGTTVGRVARYLHDRPITVVTRNLAVFTELVDDPAVELVLLGGAVRPAHRSLVGHLTEESLRQLRADVLLLGTSGIRRSGHSVDTVTDEVPVKRAMIAAADEVVVLADASKFPGSGTATVCDVGAYQHLITDAVPEDDVRSALERGGVGVEVTGPAPAHHS
ncbi:DeoR/GlpR family transcriptional regulator of sugar metabolism [Kineococcus radiotolerans]|uniref:DeoR/GlpR family transcriptional regulator of sugar metabolism n=1 Tax=Kineococcus radiotolerans TaxID=131568 RepID=A0A7W4TLI0_KINRA|nr:DeoR/GlpR family DNA-binding transcription regulator [Kineococcus radiotolerans]MBB2901109.1 DeoR/GlpR family transcriptional regulator of sugar metabolism [Kineococcus radiotolerans]